jgi:hypothetical protein
VAVVAEHSLPLRMRVTAVLPELADSQLVPPLVTGLRQDMAGFRRRRRPARLLTAFASK